MAIIDDLTHEELRAIAARALLASVEGREFLRRQLLEEELQEATYNGIAIG
jgi:hypothetical protein